MTSSLENDMKPRNFSFGKPAYSGCRSKFRGIALMELMLATAILGIALIALGIAVGRCVHALAAADRVQVALDVAQTVLAESEVKARGEGEYREGTSDGERTIHNQKFIWRGEIQSTEDPKIMKFVLTVTWREGAREQQRGFVKLIPRSIRPPT